MKKSTFCLSIMLLMAFSIPMTLSAQVFLTNTNTVTIDFDSTFVGVNEGLFSAAGVTPTPITGQLNSNAWEVLGFSQGDLLFGNTGTTSDYAQGTSTGGVFSGGIYAWEVRTGNYAMGVQPTGGDFTPGSITLKVVNNTGSALDTLKVAYDMFINNDADRGNFVKFSYSDDNTNFTNISSMMLLTPEVSQGMVSWDSTHKETLIAFNSVIPDGGSIYLRWSSEDTIGSGGRDEIAWDNISLQAYTGAGCSTTFNTITESACDYFTFNNQTLSASGTYYDTLMNAAGCDSIITLNLTIINVDTNVNQIANVLTANASSATFQWLDCNNNHSVISGATNAVYTAIANGDYAVEVTQGNCVDTSFCHVVTSVGIETLENDLHAVIYPNPANEIVYINLSEVDANTTLVILNSQMQMVRQTAIESLQTKVDVSELNSGVYFIKVNATEKQTILKLIIQ